MLKRILTVLLAVLMVVALVPGSRVTDGIVAYAADEVDQPVEDVPVEDAPVEDVPAEDIPAGDDVPEVEVFAKINEKMYATLAEAVADAQPGDTVVLLADVALSSILVIDKVITLDGNGYTLTSSATRAINVDVATEKDEQVVIKDLTVETAKDTERAINVIQKTVNLLLDNVVAEGFKYTVNVATSSENSTIAINGGKYSGYAAINITGIGTQLTVSNAELIGINNAAAHPSNNFSVISVVGSNSTVTVTGGKITAISNGNNRQFLVLIKDELSGISCDNATVKISKAEFTLVNKDVQQIDYPEKGNKVLFSEDYESTLSLAGFATGAAKEAGFIEITGKAPIQVETPEVEEVFTPDEDLTEEEAEEVREAVDDIIKDVTTNAAVTNVQTNVTSKTNESVVEEAKEELVAKLTEAGMSVEEVAAIEEAVEKAVPVVAITLAEVEMPKDTTAEAPSKLTFTVTPQIVVNDTSVKISNFNAEVTFRLPIPAAEKREYANIYHNGTLMGVYTIKMDEQGNKYVEVTTKSFSEFAVEPISDVVAAKIGDVEYASFAAAVAAVKEGETIVLQLDVEVNSPLSINKSIDIDANGYTVSVTGALAKSSVSGQEFLVRITNGVAKFGGMHMTIANGGYVAYVVR